LNLSNNRFYKKPKMKSNQYSWTRSTTKKIANEKKQRADKRTHTDTDSHREKQNKNEKCK